MSGQAVLIAGSVAGGLVLAYALLNPRARTERRRNRYLRRKYPLADLRDLRRMARAERERARVSRKARR